MLACTLYNSNEGLQQFISIITSRDFFTSKMSMFDDSRMVSCNCKISKVVDYCVGGIAVLFS
ncbi:hypothetical protein C5167_037189 [Papaver somniferum]|uniref:Uncharacterized protein n=1 Tax=Papaver somniferum TaxID=3469 RepID=A0A4Y7I5M2_PAPSO|nr:hypothetical protein C5167_037189 [Papaver somniferum]